MKADCYAIANPSGQTLLVRSLAEPLPKLLESLKVIQQEQPHEQLQLLKSYVDGDGNEVLMELMTPWALREIDAGPEQGKASKAAVVEIWHDKMPMFGLDGGPKVLNKSKFVHVANMLVPGDSPDAALNEAYAASQNIEANWRPGKGCRSSSVGDIFVVRQADEVRAFAVASVGFEPIALST